MSTIRNATHQIGQVVRHRIYPFRGVVFDIDPVFANTDEWYEAIPAEVRPHKDQPFYHLFAENGESEYIAYVSEQNLLPDTSGTPIRHPDVPDVFEQDDSGDYHPRASQTNWGTKKRARLKPRLSSSVCPNPSCYFFCAGAGAVAGAGAPGA